jgi:hypothetical protein
MIIPHRCESRYLEGRDLNPPIPVKHPVVAVLPLVALAPSGILIVAPHCGTGLMPKVDPKSESRR